MRQNVEFESGGVTCRAWAYGFEANRPDAATPCIVMGHGLGATRDCGLAPYAEKFAAAGFAVLVFDYRHFGASDGTPRQLVSISRQLEDWRAAIAFVRKQPQLDPDAVFLWGSSFSGGHVLVVAAADRRIAGVSAQGPMMDGLAAVFNIISYAGIGRALQLTALGLVDQVRAMSGLSPKLVPLVGPVGSCSVMATADAEPGYRSIAPPDWRNEICARLALNLVFYRPKIHARRLACPILIRACETDSVAPSSAAKDAARRAGALATLEIETVGHFDIYNGQGFERGSSSQLAFFNAIAAKRR